MRTAQQKNHKKLSVGATLLLLSVQCLVGLHGGMSHRQVTRPVTRSASLAPTQLGGTVQWVAEAPGGCLTIV